MKAPDRVPRRPKQCVRDRREFEEGLLTLGFHALGVVAEAAMLVKNDPQKFWGVIICKLCPSVTNYWGIAAAAEIAHLCFGHVHVHKMGA